jgi:DNA-directed RNA polymerase specialized sigma24 family protein
MNNTFQEIIRELQCIKALIAMDRIREFETDKDKILYLAKFGFSDSEIANLVETTVGTVQVARSRAKKDSKRKSTKNKDKD